MSEETQPLEYDFETAIEEARKILEKLGKDEVPLNEGMKLYKEGMELLNKAGETLEKAKLEFQRIDNPGGSHEG